MNNNHSIKDYFINPIILKLNDDELQLREKIMEKIINSQQPYIATNTAEEALLTSMSDKNTLAMTNNRVTGIYPVSANKTNKKVIFEDGSYSYAMCAIDAIGYHYAFNKDVRIEAECEASKDNIVLSVEGGKITIIEGSQDIHILHTDLKNNDNWSSCCCNIMHFFNSKDTLLKWKKENNITAKVFAVDIETANKISWLLFSQ